MTKERKDQIVKEAELIRKNALYALIMMENFVLKLSEEMEAEFPNPSEKLRDMGISTVDNAIDDLCNGLGFILEDAGFNIKGQL